MSGQQIEFVSGALRLEGRLHAGGDGSRLTAVVLHPHPQYGGDMDNHVVTGCADALASAGVKSLRFNFRGAGRSEGAFDEGRGEADDARAAIAFMRDTNPVTGLLLVGYSFGAAIAASIADASLAGLGLISPPTTMATLSACPPDLPVFIATGDRDSVSPSANLSGIESGVVEVRVFEGVDHGWWPRIDELSAAVVGFAQTLLRPGLD